MRSVLNFPFIHKSFSFIHVDNRCCYLLSAFFRQCLDAHCWYLLHLVDTRPLHNPPCACSAPPLADVEGRAVVFICHPPPPAAPPAGPALAGSDDPPLAVSVWGELVAGPLTGLELEATRHPTLTVEWVSVLVLVVRILTSSLSS